MPPLRARVTDLADLMSPERERALEARLAAFEGETTHQIAVLTVPSLEGEPIEYFALRVAETWKLGHQGLDNGILFVISRDDRKARVEVGYGLEGAVPDAVARRVIADHAGDIEGAVDALIRAARGEAIPAERRPGTTLRRRAVMDPLPTVFFAALLGSFVALPFRRGARPLGALVGSGASGLLTWLILASVGWAVLAALLGLWLGAAGPTLGGGGRRRGGVFLPGGFGRGGGFGGGGFGGGFGGGGGGFGGGGASGRW